jgi:hypothetical protein
VNEPLRAADRARNAAKRWGPVFTLLVTSILFRVPPLINAPGTNSDAAIVGLQAMHILRGEHAVFLWGSVYQTSVDSYVAATFFTVLGVTPFALMLSALSLHVALTCFAYAMVRRHTTCGWLALALVGPLVLAPAAVHSYALYPPRQAALTLAFAALWACERAYAARRVEAWSAAGGFLALLAVYADPYATLFVPAAALLALFGAGRARRAIAFGAGALVGTIPVALRMNHPAAKHGVLSMSTDVIGHNATLLWDPCGPWAIGTKVYAPVHMMDWVPWSAPWALRVVQWVGGAAFLIAVCASAVLVFARKTDAGARRLGAVGLYVALATVAAFLVSQMVMDHFSMRYLAAIVLAMPLLALPLGVRLGARRFAALFAPWIATTAICGWMGYAPFVNGPLPVRHVNGTGAQEETLARALADRGVTYAMADYWAAYRVTLATAERLVVVPIHETQDRYRPYRDAFEKADRFAYVYDPLRSFEDERAMIAQWELDPHVTVVDRVDTGAFRALVLSRR